ncbi:coilin isoform X1 [Rousettus aegyptiacus]|uniref:Coilin n=1 Tax=Rousettus aegyptiacus TaxID=9407 RepID=A0A7J8G6Y3_ROUAE|nr:coilin isoform X1 [Rousettus aegyptiacus]KAF6455445.1 coilin [Rousettus aegyptiacus]
MAASATVRLRLQFHYPPPATPHCTDFWLLVDLNRCRVVTDLISLIRQRFGFSSGAPLGLYLEGGLLPPGESARLVRDNDCLRVKLEEREVAENPAIVSNGDGTHFLPRKAKKRSFKLEEDEETELGYKNSKKHWKRQENNNENVLDGEPKPITNQSARKKKRGNKATHGTADDDDEETKRKAPKKKEKCDYKKQTKNPKSAKAQPAKEWIVQKCSPPKASPRNSLVKAKRKGGVDIHTTKVSPSSSSESESDHESTSDGLSNVILEVRNSTEKISTALSKEGPSLKNTIANKAATKTGFNSTPMEDKITRTSSSSSDSSSESDDQPAVSKSTPERAAGFLSAVGLFAGKGCPGPGPSSQTPNATGWKHSDSNGGRQAPGPPPNVTLPASLGRGWGRGEDLLSWKGARGRGMRGRGRGRGLAVPCAVNRNAEYMKQQHLNETLTNSSTIIQNPVERQKDYSLLPLLAAAPQVGEKIAFKLLELTSDYSPDVSDYKEGKILSHNPETQQVDIEILSSLPAMKEPGKFDLVYHNENGTEVVEYAVTQEKKITVFWRELIDPRLIIESPSNTSNSEVA